MKLFTIIFSLILTSNLFAAPIEADCLQISRDTSEFKLKKCLDNYFAGANVSKENAIAACEETIANALCSGMSERDVEILIDDTAAAQTKFGNDRDVMNDVMRGTDSYRSN